MVSVPTLPQSNKEKEATRKSSPQTRQTISIIDLISEGPIQGLVEGKASVFLNNDRMAEPSEGGRAYGYTNATLALTNGSTSATLSGAVLEIPELGHKYLVIRKAFGPVTITSAYNGGATNSSTDSIKCTASSSFFTDTMLTTSNQAGSPATYKWVRLLPNNAAAKAAAERFHEENEPYIGRLGSKDSATVAYFHPQNVHQWSLAGLTNTGNTYTFSLEVDLPVRITAVSGSTVTLSSAWPGTSGTYSFDDAGQVFAEETEVTDPSTNKILGGQVQFRTGTLNQTPFAGEGGAGANGILSNPNTTLEWATGHGGSSAPTAYLASAASGTGFGLSAAQRAEVDEIRININYPGGFRRINSKGDDKFTLVDYEFKIEFKVDGAFEAAKILENKRHTGNTPHSINFEHTYDLTKYKPFEDFRVTIARKTDHQGDGYLSNGTRYDGDQNLTASTVNSLISIIKEPLTFPYTALGKITFSSKQFQDTPDRRYLCRGKLIKVPSNYITREETGTAANYNRNVTTGAVESSYQDWDGTFRDTLVYTNNPAWIFYDILTNNRYGLGFFISELDIDKFALYRIGRYCDEEIDDGNEGTEPRYTMNTYIQKRSDAYKVLKDMASNFLGILYYLEGQIQPVSDMPAGPVYTFTKANVIRGDFNYETTGSKTVANQIVVTWNNPSNLYKSEPIIIEDEENIAKTGKIIPKSAYAYGCTSEGQAVRYGKWKLFTAANQREIVSFSTGQSGIFLQPGDIVNIQDTDRFGIRYGGRISSIGTLSTTAIPLDSSVTLTSGTNNYELTVIITKPAAFLVEESSEIVSGTTSSQGDLVIQAYVDGSLVNIDTEERASNAADFNGNSIQLSWKDYYRTETRTISGGGSSVSSITVSPAFSQAPKREDIWALRELSSGTTVDGSLKEYRILGISETTDGYDLTAVEHFDSKYAAVEKEFSTYIPDTILSAVKPTDTVPPVLDAWHGGVQYDTSTDKRNVTVFWNPPVSTTSSTISEAGVVASESLSTLYQHLELFEISHNFPDNPNYPTSPFRPDSPELTQFTFENVEPGTYTVAIRTVNTLGNLSAPKTLTIAIDNRELENIATSIEGVPIGGTSNSQTTVNSSGLYSFAGPTFTFKPPQTVASKLTGSSGAASATYQQDCSNMTATTTQPITLGGYIHAHYYLLFDYSDSSDRLKLIKYRTENGISYWSDSGTGNGQHLVTKNGTVSKVANSAEITGSSTAFLTDYEEGAFIKVGSFAGKVTYVESNTRLYVKQSTADTFSGQTHLTNNLRINKTTDSIIGKIYKDGSGNYHLDSYITFDSESVLSALTVSSTATDSSGNTVITFSDNSQVTVAKGGTGDDGASVIIAYAEDANGTNASFTQGTLTFVKYHEYTGTAPAIDDNVFNSGFVQFIGDDGTLQGVVAVFADDASGTNKSFTQGTKEFVNFYEWTGTKPAINDSRITGLSTFVKIKGDDGLSGELSAPAVVLQAATNGAVSDFSGTGNVIKVFEGATALTPVTSNTSATAGQFGITTAASTNITNYNTGQANCYTVDTSAKTATFGNIPGITNDQDSGTITYTIAGRTAANVAFSFTKTQVISKSKKGDTGTGTTGDDGVRGMSHFVFDLATVNSLAGSGDTGGYSGKVNTDFISSAFVTAWTGTLTAAVAKGIVGLVQNNSSDFKIQVGDSVTLIDTPNNNAGTRIYLGLTGTTWDSSNSVGNYDTDGYGPGTNYTSTSAPNWNALSGTDFWSALVVEKFDGSVIVDGTLRAQTLKANTTFTNALTSTAGLTIGTNGFIHTAGKTTHNDADAGIFLGYDTDAHKFAVGDNTKNITWDGTDLSIAGAASISGDLKGGSITSSAGAGTAGYYLDSDGTAFIGTSQKNIKWDGTDLSIAGAASISGDLKGGSITSSAGAGTSGYYLDSDGTAFIGTSQTNIKVTSSGIELNAPISSNSVVGGGVIVTQFGTFGTGATMSLSGLTQGQAGNLLVGTIPAPISPARPKATITASCRGSDDFQRFRLFLVMNDGGVQTNTLTTSVSNLETFNLYGSTFYIATFSANYTNFDAGDTLIQGSNSFIAGTKYTIGSNNNAIIYPISGAPQLGNYNIEAGLSGDKIVATGDISFDQGSNGFSAGTVTLTGYLPQSTSGSVAVRLQAAKYAKGAGTTNSASWHSSDAIYNVFGFGESV